MLLLFVYVVLMIVGDFIAYLIGISVEHFFQGQTVFGVGATSLSLFIFLVMYFLLLGVSWVIAVKITAPWEKKKAP